MKRLLLVIGVAVALFCDAAAQTKALYDHSFIKCMGTELDGSQTLRVLGYGRKRTDAKEQAMKNAVYAVLFTGIKDGAEGCNMRPLVTEVNGRERHEDYFNVFFADGGEYKNYVSLQDTKKRSADRAKDKVGYSYEMTIRVLRSALKEKLKRDNIISDDHL